LWVDICFHGYPHHRERTGFFAADVDPELAAFMADAVAKLIAEASMGSRAIAHSG
jgi:hypothetical protein